MRATQAAIFDLNEWDDPSRSIGLFETFAHDGAPVALVGGEDSIQMMQRAPEGCIVVRVDESAALETAFRDAVGKAGVEPSRTAVVSPSPSGVAAARSGGFGLVIRVSSGSPEILDRDDADMTVLRVSDLPEEVSHWIELLEGPEPALESLDDISTRLGGRPAIFLDYDGTVTPIVEDPARAVIGNVERETLRRLSKKLPVAIISGRGLEDVQSLVNVDGMFYAGSHGFEIESPDGKRFQHEAALAAQGDLDEAQRLLEEEMPHLAGVMIERKRFAITVHTRRAGSETIRHRAGEITRDIASRFDRLTLTGGKEIHELRPAVPWDKGAAVRYVLDVLPGDPNPVYIGDDETDEDAFLAVRRHPNGVGILVAPIDSDVPTWADYFLESPAETVAFLNDFIARLG